MSMFYIDESHNSGKHLCSYFDSFVRVVRSSLIFSFLYYSRKKYLKNTLRYIRYSIKEKKWRLPKTFYTTVDKYCLIIMMIIKNKRYLTKVMKGKSDDVNEDNDDGESSKISH